MNVDFVKLLVLEVLVVHRERLREVLQSICGVIKHCLKIL